MKLDYATPAPPHVTKRPRVSAALTRAALLWPILVPPTVVLGTVVLGAVLGGPNALERAAACMTVPVALVTFAALRRTLRVTRVLRRTRRYDAWVVSQVALAADVLVLVAVGCVAFL